MFSWKKILGVFVCLVVVTGLILTGCGDDDNEDSVRDVKLGVLLPLSGGAASLGTMFKTGIQYVLDEINEGGGIQSMDGAKINVVWADDEGNPTTSATEMERLMTVDKVDCVIGPFGTDSSLSASPLSDKYKIPSISLFGGESLASLNLNYWRTVSPGVEAGDYGRADVDFLKYLVDEFDIEHDSIAVSTLDNDSGKDMRDAILEKLEEYSLDDNVTLDQRIDPTAADLSSYALQAKAVDADVQITFLEYPATTALWVRAMHDTEYYPPVYINGTELLWGAFRVGMVTADIYDDVFSEEHTSVFATPIVNATVGFDSCQDYIENFSSYCAANGLPSTYWEMEAPAIASQAMYVLWDALEAAGSAKAGDINAALRNLKIDEEDTHFIIPVFAPAVEWDSNGNMKNYSPIMCQIQDGVKVIVWPEDLAEAEPRL